MARTFGSAVRITTALLAAALVAGLLASCSDDDGDQIAAVKRAHTVVAAGCDKIECTGEIDGAKYELRLPEVWNGTLLIYSHGFRQAAPSPPDFAPVSTEAAVASTNSTAEALLTSGYALIGSAYASNGWAYADGVRAGEQLHEWFTKTVGTPERVYVWGDSLGGLITQGIAEKHPDWVSGAAPMCGVLGGLNLNLDLALDLAYAVKTLLYPEMKLTGYASHDEAVKYFTEAQKRIMAATKDLKNGVPKLLAVQGILDGPTKTSRFDGRSVTSQASAVVESALTGLVYATVGRYDIEQRVGGNPSTNEGVDYAQRVTKPERILAETLAPGAVDQALAALATGKRVPADPEARRKAQELGNPTGRLKDPTITMHTAYDPLVLVQNETVFSERVSTAEGRTADLAQLFTQPPNTYSNPAPYGAGHCNFTDGERTGLIQLLDDWVRRGTYPAPAVVSRVFHGATGYVPTFKPGPWPASATR